MFWVESQTYAIYASSAGGSFINASLGGIREGGLWKAINLVGEDGHFMLKK